MPPATGWMDLEGITLSDGGRQRKTNTSICLLWTPKEPHTLKPRTDGWWSGREGVKGVKRINFPL